MDSEQAETSSFDTSNTKFQFGGNANEYRDAAKAMQDAAMTFG